MAPQPVGHKGSECLIWPFTLGESGRGTVLFQGVSTRPSRVMCILAHGEPPDPEDESAHSCGKGHEGCVHPGHLSWKSRAGNQQDRLRHGTHNRGERDGVAKLTQASVTEIFRRASTGERKAKIAADFGVHPRTVRSIATGESWSWLTRG